MRYVVICFTAVDATELGWAIRSSTSTIQALGWFSDSTNVSKGVPLVIRVFDSLCSFVIDMRASLKFLRLMLLVNVRQDYARVSSSQHLVKRAILGHNLHVSLLTYHEWSETSTPHLYLKYLLEVHDSQVRISILFNSGTFVWYYKWCFHPFHTHSNPFNVSTISLYMLSAILWTRQRLKSLLNPQ